MIEQALREKLEPIVIRRRRLILARWLICVWAGGIGLGLILLALYGLWGWRSPGAVVTVVLVTLSAVLMAVMRSRRLTPDWKAVAQTIEQDHPEVKALLLTAIEQKPQGPQGQWGYLQKGVFKEALVHATCNDWVQSVPRRSLILADAGWVMACLIFTALMFQWLPTLSLLPRNARPLLAPVDYQMTVHPGDTSVESGTPVVVVARFAERVPDDVRLVFQHPDQGPQQIILTQNLDDPVFGGMLPEVTANLVYHVAYAKRRSRDYHIQVYEHPALTRMDARIVYPAYTQLPEKELKDTRQVHVVEGSQVTLTFLLNKPVDAAQLVMTDGSTQPLTLGEQANVYTTSLTATETRRYQLELIDAQGLTNELAPRVTLEVFQNLPPALKPIFPNRDIEASPLEEVTLHAEVSDDFALLDYGVAYTLVGTPEQQIPLRADGATGAAQTMESLLALEDLGAQPDQLLTYYFWADDCAADGTVRRTASDIFFAEIRPFEEIYRESQSSGNQDQQNRQQEGSAASEGNRTELVQLQKQIITATWNIKQRAEREGDLTSQLEDLDVVNQSQAEALENARSAQAQAQDPASLLPLQAAAEFMQTTREHLTRAIIENTREALSPALAAEQSAYQELLKLRQRENQVGQSRNGQASNRGRSARQEQQLRQLELKQQENRYETQRLAGAPEQAQQMEDLQFHNRLRDLARRQSEMADRLKEAEAALQLAENETEREQVLRELKRLREEQMAALRDMDDLQQRMEQPETRQRVAEAREQLERSRSRVQQSTEDLEQSRVSQAITETTRAQRELEEMRDDFRKQSASRFSQELRDLREQAQQLDRNQQDIAEEIDRQVDSQQKILSESGQNREWADRVEQQRQQTEAMVEQMKQISEQSETPEPLLSRKLYDTLRRVRTGNVEKTLEITEELLRRNFLPQAQEVEQQANTGIKQLRQGVEDAARHVLGDEAEALRLARRELDDLIRQVEEETASSIPGNQPTLSDTNEPGAWAAASASPDRPDLQNRQNRQGRAEADAQGRRGQRASQNPAETASPSANAPAPSPQDTPGNSPRPGSARSGAAARNNTSPENASSPTGGANRRGPFTGGDFRQWDQRLRVVEEMLGELDLRNEAARVRDRARTVRAEFVRHAKEPQWDLVRTQIMQPLDELRKELSDRLAQLETETSLVPIDRDPVPDRYTEQVRRYFETLGERD